MKLVMTTALLAAFAALGCSKDKEPETAHSAKASEETNVFEEAGGAVGGAAEDVGGTVSEGATDVAETTTLEGTVRYVCEGGEEFTVDYENEGRSAKVTMEEDTYWVDLQSDTGHFMSREVEFWTSGKDLAQLKLPNGMKLTNCERQ